MATSTTATYTLDDRGTELEVVTWTEPGTKRCNCARLSVDGRVVDEGATEEIGHVDLGKEAGHPTRVSWWWTGRVARVALVEPGLGNARLRSVDYAPPPGTRAARIHAWGEAHPKLYAARHVVANLGGTIIAVLGVGALVSALVNRLLPRIDLGWLPDLDAPEWLAYLDPFRYLAPLLGWVPPLVDRLFGWIPWVDAGWIKYVVGFVVAVSVAVREVRRRNRIADPERSEQRTLESGRDGAHR